MFFDKVKNKQSGILLYGITPPKAQNTSEKTLEISQKRIAHIQSLPIDGMVIYDLQDESNRNSQERPFPFLPTIDAYNYTTSYLHELAIPKIIYRSVGKLSEEDLSTWVQDIQQQPCATVFVGAPSRDQVTQLRLSEAYDIWNTHNQNALLGGVTISERHQSGRSEHLKIVQKMEAGCSFFISQCVYNVEYTKNVLSDLYFYCQSHQRPIPTIIFTLTTCGSIKTIDFMEWLGIHMPIWLKNELANCQNILQRSVELSLHIANELVAFCKDKGIPFGFNVESVSIRKDEIEASLYLVKEVDKILTTSGARISTNSLVTDTRA
ncbi:methylenetetrahydrofolate reductase [Xanthocytophaga flava]|uniref:methylenetetrahydrofolate reductase n=1 Tax=Xanthocytophaga flava TaxID=3048013 RepID=UPI0028CFFFE4|nr:hypothetical protein [Xanthocytophaga flavus]MDJ1469856.1 methylenetetrahydrofolate reductase [Xanthocytophaga flavus]